MSFKLKTNHSFKHIAKKFFRHSVRKAITHPMHSKGFRVADFLKTHKQMEKWRVRGRDLKKFLYKEVLKDGLYGGGSYNDAAAINAWYGSPNNRTVSQLMGGR